MWQGSPYTAMFKKKKNTSELKNCAGSIVIPLPQIDTTC